MRGTHPNKRRGSHRQEKSLVKNSFFPPRVHVISRNDQNNQDPAVNGPTNEGRPSFPNRFILTQPLPQGRGKGESEVTRFGTLCGMRLC